MERDSIQSYIVERYESEKQADKAFEREARRIPGFPEMIPCTCLQCGGEGFAQKGSPFNFAGILMGCRCICGGPIRRNDYIMK